MRGSNSMMVTVYLRKPLTFYDLKCKLRFIMGRKITDEDLRLLLDQGLSQVEIARKVGVSEQAISWRVKRLKAKQASQDQDLYTMLDDSNYQGNPSIKNQLNEKELKFLELYLSGEYTIEKAMNAAGYIGYNLKYLYRLSRKIVEKFESRAADSRKIARAIGAGEVFIIKTLYSLAKDSKSEKIRGDNAMNLAKILGLTKEQLEGAGGVTIVFEGPGAQTQALPGAPPPLPPSQGDLKVVPAANRKPMMITK